MLIIHPGFPKTGTTYLQNQLRSKEWYFGPLKGDEVSSLLSDSARFDEFNNLESVIEQIWEEIGKFGTAFISEESFLSLRPYEIASKIGIYRNISIKEVDMATLLCPTRKLSVLNSIIGGREHVWLITVRRHIDWCFSTYKYTLAQLGPRRAGIFIRNLVRSSSLGSPCFSTAIDFIKTIDPKSEILVVPMEIFTDVERVGEFESFMKDQYALEFTFDKSNIIENASKTPLPASYVRVVTKISHVVSKEEYRALGKKIDTKFRGWLNFLQSQSRNQVDLHQLKEGLAGVEEYFREDTKRLQLYCPFDLEEIGYTE